MQTTLVPDDLLDRQSAALERAADGLAQIVGGQRRAFAAALDLSRNSLEAVTFVARSIIAAGLELADRATTSAARSAELVNHSLTATDEQTLATPARSRATTKEAA
jgi:hypothetical protein